MEKKVSKVWDNSNLSWLNCIAPTIRDFWDKVAELTCVNNKYMITNWNDCIKQIKNYVILLLWETLKKENINWKDIWIIWDILKKQAIIIKSYMTGPILQIDSDFIDFYKNKINDKDFNIYNIEELKNKNLNNILLTLKFNAILIVESLYQRWDALLWEEMSFFWTELLDISMKIDFLNHYIIITNDWEKK